MDYDSESSDEYKNINFLNDDYTSSEDENDGVVLNKEIKLEYKKGQQIDGLNDSEEDESREREEKSKKKKNKRKKKTKHEEDDDVANDRYHGASSSANDREESDNEQGEESEEEDRESDEESNEESSEGEDFGISKEEEAQLSFKDRLELRETKNTLSLMRERKKGKEKEEEKEEKDTSKFFHKISTKYGSRSASALRMKNQLNEERRNGGEGPIEQSAKERVGIFRKVKLPGIKKAQKGVDPRFADMSQERMDDDERAQMYKAYSHVYEMRKQEVDKLKKLLRTNANIDEEQAQNIHKKISKHNQVIHQKDSHSLEQQILKENFEKNKERVKGGLNPYFIGKQKMKDLIKEKRLEQLKADGKMDQYKKRQIKKHKSKLKKQKERFQRMRGTF